MATSTGEVEKINVRSPFYLTVDSEGAPPAYTPPATLTQPLGCGEQINIGEDVGTRIYEVDVSNRSGTFRINYTIYRPIKITYQLTEDSAPTVVGYRGGDSYEQELIDLGISPSELTNLSSGDFDNSYIQITRTSDAASTLTITVDAPLESDDYRLLMQCPDETVIETPSAGTPSDNNLDTGTYTMLLSVPLTYSDNASNTSMKIYINGELINTISPASLNFVAGQTRLIVFSTESGYNYAGGGSVITVSNEEFLANQYNDVSFTFETGTTNNYVSTGRMEVQLTALFQNPSSGNLEWADPRKYTTYSNYGYGGNPPSPSIPRIGAETFSTNFNFRDKIQKGFTFNPSDYLLFTQQVGNFDFYEKVIGGETVERIYMRQLAAIAFG